MSSRTRTVERPLGAIAAMLLSWESGQHVATTLDVSPAALYVALVFLAMLATLAGVLSVAGGAPDARGRAAARRGRRDDWCLAV